MKTFTLSQEEFVQIASQHESHVFDFKQSAIKPAKLEEVAVSFANADGGEIIIGIKDHKENGDPNERWEGVPEIEALNAHLQVLFKSDPPLNPQYEILKHENKKGYALRIQLEKGPQVAKTAAGKVFQRQGAQCLPVTRPDQIQQLTFAKGASSFEDQILKDVPTEVIVESDVLKDFLNELSPKTDPLEFAMNQNLIDYKEWHPKVCSVLLFHSNPSSVIPTRCAIKITRYETREDNPERDHLAQQETIEGPSYQTIEAAVKCVTDIMSNVEVWTPEGRKHLEFPPEAIWEIIVNAIIHRDYSIADDVQILIYNDRIEVKSPGKLPGYVNIENILDARFSRNPKMVRILNRYKNAPNKDLGEGLNTTFQKMKEFGLKEPILEEEGNYFKVTLPHVPLAAPTEAILEFLKHNEEITNAQARELTGIKSENVVKTEFYKLRDSGEIERVPDKNGSRSAWRLIKN